jgi:Reverse transcriptase (RNA-dependent DNA polymerase)
MVSHFNYLNTSILFSEHLNESIDYTAMQSILDKQNITFDGISIDGIFNSDNLLAFAAGTNNNPDILSQEQMLKASDCKQFLKLQQPEIQGLCNTDVFEFHPIANLPSGSRLLNTIWSFHHKHLPTDRILLQNKSMCVDGSQQQYGIDYRETYMPVVHWSTVQMVIILSGLLQLKSRQVDYTQVFLQAPLANDVFICIPQGWSYDSTKKKLVQNDSDPHSQEKKHFIRLKQIL